MKGVDDISTQPPNIFNFDRDDFVDFNYDLKGLGYTPNFVKQLTVVFTKTCLVVKRKCRSNEVARCSGFVEMSGGKTMIRLSILFRFFPSCCHE